MKRFILILTLWVAISSPGWTFGIVNNSGSLPADSLCFGFSMIDSSGNLGPSLADGDSVFVVVNYPNGTVCFQDSGAYNDGKIVASTNGGTVDYVWKVAVADIDGSGMDGVYHYKIKVHDKTGADLWSWAEKNFQLYQNSDFDVLLTALADTVNGILDTLQLYDDWIAHQSTVDSTYDSLALAATQLSDILDTLQNQDDWIATIANQTLIIDTVNGIIDTLQSQDGWIASGADLALLTTIAANNQDSIFAILDSIQAGVNVDVISGAERVNIAGAVWTYASGRSINGIASGTIEIADFATGWETALSDTIWAGDSRTLTELDEDNTTIDLDGTTIGLLSTAGMDALWEYDTSLVSAGMGQFLKDTTAFQGAAGSLDSATVYAAVAAVLTDSTSDLDEMKMAFWNTPFDTTTTAGSILDSLTSSTWVQGAISSLTLADIADAVWDEAQSGHVSAGTFGYYLDNQVSAVSASLTDANMGAIADSVWEKVLSGYSGDGNNKAGEYLLIAGDSTLWADISSIYSVDSTTIDTSRFAEWLNIMVAAAFDTNKVTVEAIDNDVLTAAVVADGAIDATAIESGAYAAMAQRNWSDTTITYSDGQFGRFVIDLWHVFKDSSWAAANADTGYAGLNPWTFTRIDSTQNVVFRTLHVQDAITDAPVVLFRNSTNAGDANSAGFRIQSAEEAAYAFSILGAGGAIRANGTAGSAAYLTGTLYGFYAQGGDIGARFVGDTALFIDGTETDLFFDSLGLPIESLIGYYVWNLDTSTYNSAGTYGILMDARISDAGAAVSISDADISTMMDSLFLRQVSDTVSQADSTYMARLLKYSSVGGAGGSDTASIHAMMEDAGYAKTGTDQVWQLRGLYIVNDTALTPVVTIQNLSASNGLSNALEILSNNNADNASAVYISGDRGIWLVGDDRPALDILSTDSSSITLSGDNNGDIELADNTTLIASLIDSMVTAAFTRYDTSGGSFNLTRLNVIGSASDSGVVNFINTAGAPDDYAMKLHGADGLEITAHSAYGGGYGVHIEADTLSSGGVGIFIDASTYGIYALANGASSVGALFGGRSSGIYANGFGGGSSGIYASGTTYGLRTAGGSADFAMTQSGAMYAVGSGGMVLSAAERARVADSVWMADSSATIIAGDMSSAASQTAATALTAVGIADAMMDSLLNFAVSDTVSGAAMSQLLADAETGGTGGCAGVGSALLKIYVIDSVTNNPVAFHEVTLYDLAGAQYAIRETNSAGWLTVSATINDTVMGIGDGGAFLWTKLDSIEVTGTLTVDTIYTSRHTYTSKTWVYVELTDIGWDDIDRNRALLKVYFESDFPAEDTCNGKVVAITEVTSNRVDSTSKCGVYVIPNSCLTSGQYRAELTAWTRQKKTYDLGIFTAYADSSTQRLHVTTN